MKFSMARKFAFQNLKANRILEIPFVLSSGIMLMLFNIMISLINNKYVQTRHKTLPELITMGAVVVGIFTIIFVMYTTNFLLKKRNKEFALYAILGLEKKHIRKIISIEFFVLFSIIAILGMVGGYIFGQISFLGLNRLMHDVTGRIMDYPFSITAMIVCSITMLGLYFITIARSSYRIYMTTPVQLLGKQHSGEGEPKSRFVLTIIGLAALCGGYGIALTTEGTLSALVNFFIASLLVIAATYLLFISFSIIILKMQRRRKSYFKPEKFLGVSGLLYRMKSNAVSLASIAVMSVGIIITLSATATIYSNIQKNGDSFIAFSRDYVLTSDTAVYENNFKDIQKNLENRVSQTVTGKAKIKDSFIELSMNPAVAKKGNSIETYTRDAKTSPYFMFTYDLASYNKKLNKNISLKDDEVLMTSNRKGALNMSSLKIGDRTFKVREIDNKILYSANVDSYALVVKDLSTMQYIASVLKTYNIQNKTMENSSIKCSIEWNVSGINKNSYDRSLSKLKNDNGYTLESRVEVLKGLYELNGGFLFLGVLIGIIFLTGTILVIYYKQISEGYEDREKYQIMKKIGLNDDLIKKTGASQIVWMLYAPLMVAIVHCMVASKIVYQLLKMFGVNQFTQYGTYFGLVIGVFFVIYFVIFKMTSRTYYKIVK